METHGERMARRHQAYTNEGRMFFLTTFSSREGVLVTHEVRNPLLKGPRWVVTCPVGTDVADVAAAFAAANWPPEIYQQWWEKNGKDLVRQGSLHE